MATAFNCISQTRTRKGGNKALQKTNEKRFGDLCQFAPPKIHNNTDCEYMVIPMHRSVYKSIASDYRPISLTSTFCIIL